MCINPLKVRNKEHTIEKPIKTIYVPNAVVKKADKLENLGYEEYLKQM